MIDIVCNIDNDYTNYCGVMLTGLLLKNREEKFRVHIINNCITDVSRRKIDELEEKFQVEIVYYDVPYSLIEKFPMRGKEHVSIVAYLRVFMSELLPDTIDKVLYLDCDLMVVDSIRDLWNTDLSNCAVAAVEERPPFDADSPMRLGYPVKYSYFNSGVMLVNLKRWREMDLANRARTFIAENYRTIKYHDQDVLNALLCEEHRFISIRWNLMDFFQYLHPDIQPGRMEDLRTAFQNPVIVHFTGTRKPWLHNCDSPYRGAYIQLANENGWPVISRAENIHYYLRYCLYYFLYILHLKKRKILKIYKGKIVFD